MKDDDSILDAEYLNDNPFGDECRRQDAFLRSQGENPPAFFRRLADAHLSHISLAVNQRNVLRDTRERYERMGAKRKLLLKLSSGKKYKLKVVLNEAETKLYLSLMPKWKSILVQLMWSAESLSRCRF